MDINPDITNTTDEYSIYFTYSYGSIPVQGYRKVQLRDAASGTYDYTYWWVYKDGTLSNAQTITLDNSQNAELSIPDDVLTIKLLSPPSHGQNANYVYYGLKS